MKLVLFFAAFALAIAFFVVSLRIFRRFDKMMRHLYETEHERWAKLGRPIGYFWFPPGEWSFFSSCYSRDAMFFQFLARGCKWPNKAPEPTPGAVTPRATEGTSK